MQLCFGLACKTFAAIAVNMDLKEWRGYPDKHYFMALLARDLKGFSLCWGCWMFQKNDWGWWEANCPEVLNDLDGFGLMGYDVGPDGTTRQRYNGSCPRCLASKRLQWYTL